MSILRSGEILVPLMVLKIKDGIMTHHVCVSILVIITLNSSVTSHLEGFSKDHSIIQILHVHRDTDACLVLYVSIK